MALYFFFSDEPYGLPKQARAIFESHRQRLDRYRNSVMNGAKNGQKPSEKREIPAQDIDIENLTENSTPTGLLPAELIGMGTHPDTDPEGVSGGGVRYPQKETVNRNINTPPHSPAKASDHPDDTESLFGVWEGE